MDFLLENSGYSGKYLTVRILGVLYPRLHLTSTNEIKKLIPFHLFALQQVTDLPQILSINCGLTNEKEMNFLRRQMNRNSSSSSQNQSTESTEKPFGTSTPMKPCRYGINCSRVDCHFAHSDRKSPTAATSTTSAPSGTSPSSSTPNQRSSPWFPLQFTMEIDEDTSDLTVDSNCSNDASAENESDFLKNDASPETEEKERKISENTISSTRSSLTPTSLISSVSQRKLYKLSAVVCQVNNGPQKNLVALICVNGKYHKMKLGEMDESHSQWYIFNDFRWE